MLTISYKIRYLGDFKLMSKWKIFGKSKKEEKEKPDDNTEEPIEKEEIVTKKQDENLVDYNETLYTSDTKTKKKTKDKKEYQTKTSQTVWRDVDSIEKNIDNLHITRAQKPVTDLDKTVDKILDKRKKK